MGNITVRCFKTEKAASDAAEKALGAGKKVAVGGPTDIVAIHGEAPPKILWDSGDQTDWYVVIETGDALVMPGG